MVITKQHQQRLRLLRLHNRRLAGIVPSTRSVVTRSDQTVPVLDLTRGITAAAKSIEERKKRTLLVLLTRIDCFAKIPRI
jgi:hypothetical protein